MCVLISFLNWEILNHYHTSKLESNTEKNNVIAPLDSPLKHYYKMVYFSCNLAFEIQNLNNPKL